METKTCFQCGYTGPCCSFKKPRKKLCKICYNKKERERRKRKRNEDLTIRICDTCGFTMVPDQASSSYASRCTMCISKLQKEYYKQRVAKSVAENVFRVCKMCNSDILSGEPSKHNMCMPCFNQTRGLSKLDGLRLRKQQRMLRARDCSTCGTIILPREGSPRNTNQCRACVREYQRNYREKKQFFEKHFRECHVCGIIKYIPWNFTYSDEVCDDCHYSE